MSLRSSPKSQSTSTSRTATHGRVLHGLGGSGEVCARVMMVVGALELLFGPMRVAGWRAMHVRGIAAVGQVGEWDVRPERRMLEESVGGSDDGGARRQIAE